MPDLQPAACQLDKASAGKTGRQPPPNYSGFFLLIAHLCFFSLMVIMIVSIDEFYKGTSNSFRTFRHLIEFKKVQKHLEEPLYHV